MKISWIKKYPSRHGFEFFPSLLFFFPCVFELISMIYHAKISSCLYKTWILCIGVLLPPRLNLMAQIQSSQFGGHGKSNEYHEGFINRSFISRCPPIVTPDTIIIAICGPTDEMITQVLTLMAGFSPISTFFIICSEALQNNSIGWAVCLPKSFWESIKNSPTGIPD